MKMQIHLMGCAIAVAIFARTAGGEQANASQSKYNVIFILCDDLGAHDVGCFGSIYHETPHIDRLASRGVRLTQAYAASPLCSPTRASILTGQYPARIGITSPACHLPGIQLEKRLASGNRNTKVLNADSLTRLRPDYFTLAEAMKDAGYATAHFGKWHLGHNLPGNTQDQYEPKDQGFDLDFPHTPSAPGPGGGYLAPWKFVKDPTITGHPGMNIEDRMSQEAARYILQHKDQPFYLNYWAFSVHSPWNARRDYIDYFLPKADSKNPQHNPLYAAMVRSLDDGVGNLLKAVDDAGLAEQTIIVFFSDNGGWAYPPKATDPEGFQNMPATSNFPKRSGKASMYEGGTREPCIVVWPGKVKAGSTNDALIQSVDFYPTLLSMCGLKPRAALKLDGIDQSAMLKGQPGPRDRVFCHFPHGSTAQAQNIPGFLPSSYVRKGDWKLIRFYCDADDGSDRLELYNLRDDPGEAKNLASAQRERANELNDLITDFLKDTNAVVPMPNRNGGEPAAVTANSVRDLLQGWKARGCEANVDSGIVQVTGKSDAPFLGIGAGIRGPAKVKLRARSKEGGAGKIEWLKSSDGGKALAGNARPFAIGNEGWQELEIEIPAKGPLGILRLYLPAQRQSVEIDWINITDQNEKSKRWDF